MKKSITGVALLVLLTLSTAFAGPRNGNENSKDGVSKRVESSFRKEFANAEQTTWSRINKFYKAQFTLHGQVLFAVLNEDGEIISVYRNILSQQLPIRLMNHLKENYSGYWITELFELAQDNQTFYYVTLEDANTRLTLKAENSNDWFEYMKLKK